LGRLLAAHPASVAETKVMTAGLGTIARRPGVSLGAVLVPADAA
jgi:hypothetical protein